MAVPTRSYEERISPRLLSKKVCANKQTSIGVYFHADTEALKAGLQSEP